MTEGENGEVCLEGRCNSLKQIQRTSKDLPSSYCNNKNITIVLSQRLVTTNSLKMMASGVEGEFSAHCLTEKVMISDVNECKCRLILKREIKEIQEELISAKLIITLLQTEVSKNEHVGYETKEPQNSIQSNEPNAGETKETKRTEVISSRNRRTKQEKIDPGKRQVETGNCYKVLEGLQEPVKLVDGLEKGKTQGETNISRRNLKKKDHEVILIRDSHVRD